MSTKRMIRPVADNLEKYQTYKAQMERYSKAMKEGFFLEALLIDYAMLEDRLRSFLYHAGAFSDRSQINFTKNPAGRELKSLILTNAAEKKSKDLNPNNISGKILCVKTLLTWSMGTEMKDSESRFLQALRAQCAQLDHERLCAALVSLDEWRAYRNEVIHALLNKSVFSLEEELKARAEQGMEIARVIDSQVRILKKGNKVRKAANLRME